MQEHDQTEDACRSMEDPSRFKAMYLSGLNYGDCCYINSSGQFFQAKSDSTGTLPAVAIFLGHQRVAYGGLGTKHDWAWTPGRLVYVSDATAGAMTQTPPSTSGHIIQAMGVAISATTILLMPGFYSYAHA